MLDPLKAAMVPEEDENPDGDVFANKEDEDEDQDSEEPKVLDTFEELPIEIRSLTERYLPSAVHSVHRPLIVTLLDSSNPSQPKCIPPLCPPKLSPTSFKTSTDAHPPK